MSNLALLTRYYMLRRRAGNMPVRMRRAGKTKWSRGHAVWVHDVFAFRGSPAAWSESLFWVAEIQQRAPTPAERRRLRRLGDDMAVGTFRLSDGVSVDVAARREYGPALFGKVAKSRNVAKSRDVAISPDVIEAS